MEHVKVLIVDNDQIAAGSVSSGLASHGFDVMLASSVEDGLHQFQQTLPDAVIIRYPMFNYGGWDLARRIRDLSDVPILFISDRTDRLSAQRALAVGDEYMVQPWSWSRLSARLSALVRRHTQDRREVLIYEDGRLRVDVTNRQLLKGGAPVALTDMQFRLLSYLVRKANQVVSYEELSTHLWGRSHIGVKAHLSRYVASLRRLIEDDPIDPHYLLTARGVGYWFRPVEHTSGRDDQAE